MRVEELNGAAAGGAEGAKRGWLDGISRRKAFVVHLSISASVVGMVCALVFFVWYPHPYFDATGAWQVLRMIIAVDLVVGPLLTLILFKPGKWGLKFDLCAIALVQIAALLYGVTVIFAERPYFTVFAVDRYYVLARRDIDAGQLADPSLVAAERIGPRPLAGPLLVAATVPTDRERAQRLLFETTLENEPDIEARPEFWSPYGEHTAQVIARAKPLAKLRAARVGAVQDIDDLIAALGKAESELAFLPVVAKNRDFSMIIDAADGMPLEILDVDPWVDFLSQPR